MLIRKKMEINYGKNLTDFLNEEECFKNNLKQSKFRKKF